MYRFETLQLHAGQRKDPVTGAITVPIYQTNAYGYDSAAQAAARFALKESGHMYTRLSNPTTEVLEARIAALEGGIGALATASGHAAEMAAFLSLMTQGDHIVALSSLYGGTVSILTTTLPRLGITATLVDPDDLVAVQSAILPNTKLIYAENIGNPAINLVDIDALSEIAHDNGIALMVDSTFATPYLYRPFEHGADIVVHSSTKYLGGHGNSMGGLIVDSGKFAWIKSGKYPQLTGPDSGYHGAIMTDIFGSAAFIGKARVSLMRDFGACPSPFNSFLILMGIETLSLRMDKVVSNARELTHFLSAHPAVERINYPETEGSKYEAIAKRDYPRGVSGMFTFEIKGGVEVGARFIDSLKLFFNASNLADSHSMVVHPASTTHSQMSEEQLLSSGITPGMVRVSVGLEDVRDLIDDMDQALKSAVK